MTGGDDIETIKQRKKEQLMQQDDSAPTTAPNEPIHVDSIDDFDEVVATHDVVMVDFYADWCGPCKMLEPIVEELAAETDAAVAKVDVDAHQELASQYQVRGVPTVVVFAGGEVAEQVVGVRDQSHYRSLIDRHAGA
ncbi:MULTISPECIES: thioredoxin [unclassified Halorhabdus]|uniref:thioredoxin n=1 Tax=unclassified Halorhabdus TaxID=2621901 RepID=UPI0023DA94C9|nr:MULTISPECIES: thioredoxin [unclassified Halorhabdus]WEL16978.1 Thioredoxin [Halorhabdus sp. SVX81]WEL20857.1 Thioredoxin [Halorhabdus sp. BNX81]